MMKAIITGSTADGPLDAREMEIAEPLEIGDTIGYGSPEQRLQVVAANQPFGPAGFGVPTYTVAPYSG